MALGCAENLRKNFWGLPLKNQKNVGISPVARKLFDVRAFFTADLIET
jgi:hypothetical protein